MNLRQWLTTVSAKCRRRIVTEAGQIRRSTPSQKHPTAGIIVIGDEILKAQVKDTNSFYACNLLYSHGVKVRKLSVVPDEVETIAKEVRSFSNTFDYVFTAGGIGPTHDDLTYEAVALAFGDTLHHHPRLVDIVKNTFGYGKFPSPSYKLAYIPTKSVLKFGINKDTGETLPYPCVVVKNVHVFPGSPGFFESSFEALCKESFAGHKGFAADEIYVNASEESFADILSKIAQECPNVAFGSYPERNRYYKVRITIESENEKDTEAARKMFCDRVPANILVDYDRAPHVDCLAKYERLLRSERRSVYESAFETFLNYYRKPERVWIYLDGSEESIVMVHLARVVNSKLRLPSEMKLRAVCLKFDKIHESITEFVQQVCGRYGVELCNLNCEETDVPRALKRVIASRAESRVLLLGKRQSNNESEVYESVLRLNNSSAISVQVHCPLIDWTDEDITRFVRCLSLPYHTTKSRPG